MDTRPVPAPPHWASSAAKAVRLTAWVRKRPESWFWLHRRWKTAPPEGIGDARNEAAHREERAARTGGA